MKQTLLITLFSFAISSFVIASTDTFTDKLAAVGSPSMSSDPCTAIDKKVLRLDRFTEVVQNTSAFHLEEKATALLVPGITVSNNKKKMLRDAKKKYAEYAAERQKYGCETPINKSNSQIGDKMPILDSCAALDNKVMRLDRFTEVVKNTSAFHLEEKANAIPTPGITVSNNRKKMLRDADKKYAEYAAERQKYGCETPINTSTSQITEKMAVTRKSSLSSEPYPVRDKKPIKSGETTTKISSITAVHAEKKATAVPVAKTSVSDNKEVLAAVPEKKDAELSLVRQTSNVETPIKASTPQVDDKITASDNATFSSEKCNTLDQELIELSEFTTMVKNTSAFHLEEKAGALPSPGFTVSNNKKKMLRDVQKRHSQLLKERKKYGCDPL